MRRHLRQAPHRRPLARPDRRLPWLLLALALAAAGCDRGQDLRRLVPDLDPAVASLLVRGQPDRLAAHFRDAGSGALTRSFDSLHREAVFGDDARFAAVMPHLERLADIMADDFASELGHAKVASLRRVDRTDLRRAWNLNHRRDAVFADPTVSDADKLVQFHAMAGLFGDLGLLWYSVALDETLAQVHASLGQRDQMREHLQKGLAASREVDFTGMTCQILGALAEMFWEDGQVDSAQVYVDHLQDRATRSRLALQAARGETFRCSFSLAQGRLHSAHLHLKEARQLCREFQGGRHEAIYVAILARFYANLGCWSIVERLLEQTDLLLGGEVPEFLAPTVVDLNLLKAEALFERGRRGDAHHMTAAILAAANPRPHRLRYAMIAWHRARLLLKDERPDAAVPVIREGLQRAREDNLPGMDRAFTLQLARALEQQGQVVAAQRELTRFQGQVGDDDDLLAGDLEQAVALDVRLAWTGRGDGRALVAAVARGFATLQGRLAGRDPSAHTYLHIQGFDDLRTQVHRFIADDPALGLSFEMAWRRLARLRAEGVELKKIGAALPAPAPEDIATWVRRWSERVNGSAGSGPWYCGNGGAPDRTTFLLYAVLGDDVYRWQVDRDGLRRERLDLPPARLRTLVARALDRMAVPPGPGAWTGSGPLADDLSLLARELIPGDLRRRWQARRPFMDPEKLLIAADDALTRIPFETLDLDLGPDYLPLDDGTIVTYLRYVSVPAPESGPGPMLIFADPRAAPALARRYPELGALPGARQEAARVAAVWHEAPVLAGAAATKTELLARWQSASRLYLASHVVRDPEAPYLSFLPLAPDPDNPRLDDSLLETRDILAADLRGCQLVVLSGCSSGSPYVEGSRVAPGLGDAFLDAGCRTTVQTFWRIGDETAMALMGAFADRAAEGGGPDNLARALRGARISVRRRSPELAHPFHWAAHHIVTTDPGE